MPGIKTYKLVIVVSAPEYKMPETWYLDKKNLHLFFEDVQNFILDVHIEDVTGKKIDIYK